MGARRGKFGENELGMSANVFIFQRWEMGSKGRTRCGWGPIVNWVSPSNDSGGRQHAVPLRRSPRTKHAVRGSPQAKVEVGIDVCSGGGDGFEQEVTVVVTDVETVPPHVFFADESLRKLSAEFEGKMVS